MPAVDVTAAARPASTSQRASAEEPSAPDAALPVFGAPGAAGPAVRSPRTSSIGVGATGATVSMGATTWGFVGSAPQGRMVNETLAPAAPS